METIDDIRNRKIKQVIALLSFILSIKDREIMMLAIENAIDMLSDLDSAK